MFYKILYFFLYITSIVGENMNGNVYKISNPQSNKFDTDFVKISPSVEYFDIYTPIITSQYAEVYWTMMGTVNLPQKIIKRFNNSVIAIVGYETDQVFKGFGINNTDLSVPITWSYNHHYVAFMLSKDTNLIKVYNDTNDWGIYNHGYQRNWKITDNYNKFDNIPTSQFFSEGNGGESRGSFHGYPGNIAQLIKSPKIFKIQPMQIDTRNRDSKYINNPIFHPGLLPKSSTAPINAYYSGLLECPCTDRINKTIYHNYINSLNTKCTNNINNETNCMIQGLKFGKRIFNIINSTNFPEGCSFNNTDINYNNYKSNKNCSNKIDNYSSKVYLSSLNITLNLKVKEDFVYINLTGPADVWFGIGFNAHNMNDLPYTIIVNDNLMEVKLGNHNSGKILNNTLEVISNNIIDNTRIVYFKRLKYGLTSDYYSFTNNKGSINIIGAIGKNKIYSYHKKRTGTILYYINDIDNTCICNNGIKGYINGILFSKICAKEPIADLYHQKNPTCSINTYQGGLSCCHHKNILLDKNQIQPVHKMSYQLKFRFWFQSYNKHESLVRLYFQTEAYAGEYDVPICIKPYECIHMITARWQTKDMINSKYIDNNSGVKLIYAAPHCHAPSCISMELYNDDTGELLCLVKSIMGKGTNKKFDEKGYIRLDPCLWGYDDGLYNPPLLKWNSNLSSIKRNNNTYKHYGEMASWQMRGVVI